jgi:hypothetical protein
VRAKKKAAGKRSKKRSSQRDSLTDLEILEMIQIEILERLQGEDYQPKVADLLRVLDSKAKLKLSDPGKKIFWDLIDEIRREELGDDNEEK